MLSRFDAVTWRISLRTAKLLLFLRALGLNTVPTLTQDSFQSIHIYIGQNEEMRPHMHMDGRRELLCVRC